MSTQLTSEKNLLLAVRSQLRTAVVDGGAGYGDHECNIEVDDQDVPATVGQRYASIIPAGWMTGDKHRSSGGIYDFIFSVDVLVIRRVSPIPRDRQRGLLVGNLQNLNEEVDQIIAAIDYSYTVMNAANTLIETETGSTQGFLIPLILNKVDPRPRPAPAEMFGGKEETRAGMMRTVSFYGARRITTRQA